MYDGVNIYSRSDSGDKGCVHNFGGEISRKAAAWEDRQGNERLTLRRILGNRLWEWKLYSFGSESCEMTLSRIGGVGASDSTSCHAVCLFTGQFREVDLDVPTPSREICRQAWENMFYVIWLELQEWKNIHVTRKVMFTLCNEMRLYYASFQIPWRLIRNCKLTFISITTYIYIYTQNIRNYNFACGSIWVWNLVSDIKGGT
jgi:hypothetical protein